jgi:hypothetical protein
VTATGIGSLNQTNYTSGIVVYVTNGVATGGGFGAQTSNPIRRAAGATTALIVRGTIKHGAYTWMVNTASVARPQAGVGAGVVTVGPGA